MTGHTILFATNRILKSVGPNGVPDFDDEGVPFGSKNMLYAAADIDQIDTTNPFSGRIKSASQLQEAGFSGADLALIKASKNDVCVFIHGAGNSFKTSLTRAAYIKDWMDDLNINGVNTKFDFIAFSWPAADYGFSGASAGYKHDRRVAKESYHHLGSFFRELYNLRTTLDAAGRRMSLLGHSMGDYALSFAVEEWYRDSHAPKKALFDEIVLAAPDVVDTDFDPEKKGRLANLKRLGREITLYFHQKDALLQLSKFVNKESRLGQSSPPNAHDIAFFPAKVYEFIDCTRANDYVKGTDSSFKTHQYYRQSRKARADVATVLAGEVPTRPQYNPKTNWYALFPDDDSDWDV